MWSEPVDIESPQDAAARLRPLGDLVFLDSARRDPANGRYSYLAAAPFARFEASLSSVRFAGKEVEGTAFEALDAVLDRYGSDPLPERPPFQGGAVGFVAFEAGHLLERMTRPPDLSGERPLVSLGFFDTVLAIDHAAGEAVILSSGFDVGLGRDAPEAARAERAGNRIALFRDALARPAPLPLTRPSPAPDWRCDFTPDAYAAMVERVRAIILSGDIYQANVARRLEAEMPAGFDTFAFFEVLRRVNPAPFAAYLETPDRTIASASPELFLRLRDGLVETRPIKGTARRPADPTEDRAAARALLASEKDRAENVMIVDLMRNDLSRVCEPDSVEVPALCALESYAGLHHLVSSVTGRLKPGVGPGALLAATFPGGSITGAPKIRAIDILTELEASERGVYCGSIAALGFCGTADLSIAIRTVEFEGTQARFGVGGGVTILSDGAAEYNETETKAARILDAFAAHAAGERR